MEKIRGFEVAKGFENEGIKGMRKKLSNINGSLKVITDDNFKLIIKA